MANYMMGLHHISAAQKQSLNIDLNCLKTCRLQQLLLQSASGDIEQNMLPMSMASGVPPSFTAIPVTKQLPTHFIGTPYKLQNDVLTSIAHSLRSRL